MSFQPEDITRRHIFDAVKKIEDEKIELNQSRRYDVIINGKAYPPKEVMRFALPHLRTHAALLRCSRGMDLWIGR